MECLSVPWPNGKQGRKSLRRTLDLSVDATKRKELVAKLGNARTTKKSIY